MAEPLSRRARHRRVAAVGISLGLHGLVLLALFMPRPPPPEPPAPAAIQLALAPAPPPLAPVTVEPTRGAPAPRRAAPQAAATASGSPLARRQTPVPHDMAPLPAAPVASHVAGVSESELAGAATAGSGAGSGSGSGAGSGDGAGAGGGCDMVRRLQAALRRDALVQSAAATLDRDPDAHGKAIRVWNGDWVATPGEDGKGLAAVREAILWEVGFAPPACRSAPVRGLVLVSLADTPGAVRLVLGTAAWRWSDLLGLGGRP